VLAVVLKEYVVREHITQSIAVGLTSPTIHPRTVTFVTTEGTCIDQHSIVSRVVAEIPSRLALASQGKLPRHIECAMFDRRNACHAD